LQRVTAETADLLLVPAASRVPNSHRCPAELNHQSRQAPVCPRSPLTLWHLKVVQEALRAHTFEVVAVIGFTSLHTFRLSHIVAEAVARLFRVQGGADHGDLGRRIGYPQATEVRS
jgi:hypothetical protein